MRKWKVNGVNLLLILITFALGGSLCGIAGRKLMSYTNIEKGFAWFVIYIIILTIIWPLCVLLVSIPMGKFNFFKNYIRKIFNRMGTKTELKSSKQVNMAIFASGTGSNAEKIIQHFKENTNIHVALIVSNKPAAGVIQIAQSYGIETLIIEKDRFLSGDSYIDTLKKHGIQYIILAGFLLKLPEALIKAWPEAIINIHPALLPKYGGKGMYGLKVHEAVIANKETESGISIHYVDELYDHGATIMQARCPVEETDTPETLAQKIHELEHHYFPFVIEEVINAKSSLNNNG